MFLDHIGFVTKTQYKIAMSVIAVVTHDVPKDGLLANRDHGFGNVLRILSNPCPQASAKQDDFHLTEFSSLAHQWNDHINGEHELESGEFVGYCKLLRLTIKFFKSIASRLFSVSSIFRLKGGANQYRFFGRKLNDADHAIVFVQIGNKARAFS
jgi:hypothetical protein